MCCRPKVFAVQDVKYVAIKALTVEATIAMVDNLSVEGKALSRVKITSTNHPGQRHCIPTFERFKISNQWGPHFVFVTYAYGANLSALQRSYSNNCLPLDVTKRIVSQILLALDYMHTDCKLIHTG